MVALLSHPHINIWFLWVWNCIYIGALNEKLFYFLLFPIKRLHLQSCPTTLDLPMRQQLIPTNLNEWSVQVYLPYVHSTMKIVCPQQRHIDKATHNINKVHSARQEVYQFLFISLTAWGKKLFPNRTLSWYSWRGHVSCQGGGKTRDEQGD